MKYGECLFNQKLDKKWYEAVFFSANKNLIVVLSMSYSTNPLSTDFLLELNFILKLNKAAMLCSNAAHGFIVILEVIPWLHSSFSNQLNYFNNV